MKIIMQETKYIINYCFFHRYSLLKKSKERQALDGLNNLHYSPVVVRSPLYTNITVNLSRDLAPLVDTNVL